MLDKEKIKNAQNVGLDLTNDKSDEIISGYMHFEKLDSIDENREPETSDNGRYIKTIIREFIKGI